MVCNFVRWPYVREDYAVRRVVFEDILVGLGVPRPPVDAFATKPIIYVQCGGVPGGEHENDFVQSWRGQFLWMNPPYSMLDKVVHKLTEDGPSVILVVPDWPHRLWWRRLQSVVSTSLFFPRGHRVFELSGRVCGPSCWGTWAYFVAGTSMVG